MKAKVTLALFLVAAICVGVFISCTGSQTPNVPTVTPPDTTGPVVSGSITYDKSGVYSDEITYQNGTIQATDVTIENATFEESLVINAAAQGGTVTLKNVTIKGKLLIDGKIDALDVIGCQIENLNSQASSVGIQLDAQSSCQSMVLYASNALSLKGQALQLTVISDSVGNLTPGTIVLQKGSNVQRLLLQAKSKVVFDEAVDTVLLNANAAGSELTVNEGVTLPALASSVKLVLQGKGKVEKAAVTSKDLLTGSLKPQTIYVNPSPINSDLTPNFVNESSGSQTPWTPSSKPPVSSAPSSSQPEIETVIKFDNTIPDTNNDDDDDDYTPVRYFTVQFASEESAAIGMPNNQSIREGARASKPGSDPTLAGFTFLGWYQGDTLFDFTTPIRSNITLTAKWVPTAWDGVSIDATWYTNNPSAASYTLKQPAQLAGLAQLVNQGTDFTGKTITLGYDLDLSNAQNWTPIGTGTRSENVLSGNAFTGVFDGQGHTIKGLTIAKNTDDDSGAGLFGTVKGATAVVQNLHLTEVSIEAVSNAGAIAGFIGEGATIRNCTASGTITVTESSGGIVGRAIKEGHIVSCVNNASLKGSKEKIGGIVGGAYYGTESGKLTIENCQNNGTVEGAGYVGGIAGLGGLVNITDCVNNGAVTSTADVCGGIVGMQKVGGSIQNCINQVPVTGQSYTGGIIGWICYMDGAGNPDVFPNNLSTSVVGCQNTQTVTGVNAVGGIVGTIYWSGTISGCQNTGNVVATGGMAGGILGNAQYLFGDSGQPDQNYSSARTNTVLLQNCTSQAASIQAANSVGLLVGHESLPPEDKIGSYPATFAVENCTCQYLANIPAANGSDITEDILRAIAVKDGETVVYPAFDASSLQTALHIALPDGVIYLHNSVPGVAIDWPEDKNLTIQGKGSAALSGVRAQDIPSNIVLKDVSLPDDISNPEETSSSATSQVSSDISSELSSQNVSSQTSGTTSLPQIPTSSSPSASEDSSSLQTSSSLPEVRSSATSSMVSSGVSSQI